MANQSKTHTPQKTKTALDKFQLAFEYDRTWSEAKQTVQHRPIKK